MTMANVEVEDSQATVHQQEADLARLWKVLKRTEEELDERVAHLEHRCLFSEEERSKTQEEGLRRVEGLKKELNLLKGTKQDELQKQIQLQQERAALTEELTKEKTLVDSLSVLLGQEREESEEQLRQLKEEMKEVLGELTGMEMQETSRQEVVQRSREVLQRLQEENNLLETQLMSCQGQMMELCQMKQKLEDTLRQRERELTALKGALKEEVATHEEIEVLQEQYSADMEKLRSSMEQVSQSHGGIEAERSRVNVSVRSLQQQLEDCRDELRTTKQELLQARLDKEEYEEELKELQDKISTMKQQMPDPGHTQTLNQELQRCNADLRKARSEVEKQRTEMDKKVLEVISVKKSHQEQEAELKYEIGRLQDQLLRAKDDFGKAQEKNKRLPDPAIPSELEHKLDDARSEASQLKELSLVEEELEASKTCLSRSQVDLKSLEDAQQEQRDHLSLRVKALKRQVDEGETELERTD